MPLKHPFLFPKSFLSFQNDSAVTSASSSIDKTTSGLLETGIMSI